MLDLAVVNGTVVDGTGTEPRRADVGVRAGKIVAVVPPGTLPEVNRTIDATDHLVTPGFIDPHTHLDAQLWWDPSGAPSVLHGVTTVVIGSCGFGIAPSRPDQREYTLRSLESVEEIPYTVTSSAVPMSWTTWPEFFEQLGQLPLGVNVAGFVPHSPLLYGTLTLGEQSAHGPLDQRQRADVKAALADALRAGAIGIASSRGSNHSDAFGEPVPSRSTSDDELRDLLELCEDKTWQINIKNKGNNTPEGIAAARAELETYTALSETIGCRLTWTPLVASPGDDVGWRALLAMAESGPAIARPQVSAQSIVSSLSFTGPSYAALVDGWSTAFVGYGDLTADEKRSRLSSPEFRRILKSAPQSPDRVTAPWFPRWTVAYSPSNAGLTGRSLDDIARERGVDPVDAMCDLVLDDGLATLIDIPLCNVDDDAVRRMVTSPATILGMGDSGAHVNSITNYSYPTTVLADLCLRRGWMSVAACVAELTSRPAEVLGIPDRGVIAEQMAADLCVIAPEEPAVGATEVRDDLPGGARRLHRGASGYRAVIVNGEIVVEHDRLTGVAGGRLVR